MLFRIQINPESESDFNFLGYEWLEVLAIEPRAIANKEQGYGPWCHKLLFNWYICLTEHGLIRIPDADFWAAIESYKHAPSEKEPAYQIVAGARSVIQIHSPGSRVRTQGDNMRDKYVAEQVGAQGPRASAHDIQFLKVADAPIDLTVLAAQLSSIRQEMKRGASAAEDDLAVGAVASAELAANEGDAAGTIDYLKRAGKWAFDVATKLGTDVAAKAISHALTLDN